MKCSGRAVLRQTRKLDGHPWFSQWRTKATHRGHGNTYQNATHRGHGDTHQIDCKTKSRAVKKKEIAVPNATYSVKSGP